MKISEAEVLVNAPSQMVWDVLTDTGNVTVWESGIVDIDGEIRDGGIIRVTASGRKRSSRFRVHQVPGRAMTWRGGLPLGLLRRTISVILTPQAEATRLQVTHTLGGPLLPIVRLFLPTATGSLTPFVQAVRARAELLDRHSRPEPAR